MNPGVVTLETGTGHIGPEVRAARLAGVLYLVMAVTGAFSVMYVPGALIVPANATRTANNILAHEMLFRLGIVGELFSATVFIFLVLVLYRIFNPVNKTHASFMVILALVSVPIAFVIVLNEIAALTLLRGADFLGLWVRPQREAMAMLFLDLHRYGFVINQNFWGLWLFPFSLLVMKSGFMPRILGILLLVNGVAYLAMSSTSLLFPTYETLVSRVSMPAITGEVWIIAWLLMKGKSLPRLAAAR